MVAFVIGLAAALWVVAVNTVNVGSSEFQRTKTLFFTNRISSQAVKTKFGTVRSVQGLPYWRIKSRSRMCVHYRKLYII